MQKGNTLLELSMVMGIVVLVAAAALPSFAAMRRSGAISEAEATIVGALELARTRAMAGMGESGYGARISAEQVIVTADPPQAQSTAFPLPPGISPMPLDAHVVFMRLTGAPSSPATIYILYRDTPVSRIVIDAHGTISLIKN